MEEKPTNSKERPLVEKNEPVLALLKEWDAGPDTNRGIDILLHAPREVAESVKLDTGQRMFGALPHLEKREEILSRLPEELQFFGEAVSIQNLPALKRMAYIEGLVLYEIKFGERLSNLTKEILAHYPDRRTRPGTKISIFGLSGAGKSTVLEAMKEIADPDRTVFIDNDTTRYNLFAKKFKETDGAAGVSKNELQRLIHNRISGALYMTLEYVTVALKKRGYDVVVSATAPSENSDYTIYVEHRYVDPRDFRKSGTEEYDDEAINAMARELFQSTEKRSGGGDNYDWDNAETVTDFRRMKDVFVRVPEAAHRNHVKSIGRYLLERENVKVLKNAEEDDVERRMRTLKEQLGSILKE